MNRTSYIGKPIRARWIIALIVMLSGCQNDPGIRLNYYFPGHQWERFNILSFEIPVDQPDQTYDIVLTAGFLKDFPYETLDFNMVLRTAAGEERINEYQLEVKSKDGKFSGTWDGDTVRSTITLKRGLKIGKAGILKIELENLVPRMSTTGITGVGIGLVSSGK